MKKVLFLLLSFVSLFTAQAQIVNPVKWSSRVEKISDTEFNLVMEAKIDDDWHVYSQFTPENGPLPAEFKFKDAKGNYELIGKVKESPYKKQYNDVFEVDEYYFEKKATFTQKIKVTNPNFTALKASVDYQVCKEVCIDQDKYNFPWLFRSFRLILHVRVVISSNHLLFFRSFLPSILRFPLTAL